jgi:hypothetical protein
MRNLLCMSATVTILARWQGAAAIRGRRVRPGPRAKPVPPVLSGRPRRQAGSAASPGKRNFILRTHQAFE